MAILRITRRLGVAALAMAALHAAEDPAPPERGSPPPVAITFTPPDLEGRIVLGIFDASNRLVRTLRLQPGTSDLKIETNGYVAQWDGRDESGADCPAGRYRARGVVIGDAVEILGEAYHFNDWVAEDGLPVTDVKLGPGIAVKVTVAGEEKPRMGTLDLDGNLRWESNPPSAEETPASDPQVGPDMPAESIFWAKGRAGTLWAILRDGAQNVVTEVLPDGEVLREFRVPVGEPQPEELRVAPDEDAILLRETGPGGLVRVRLLRSTGRTEELEEGRAVSDWEVAFERSIQPCAGFGFEDGRLVAEARETPPDFVDVPLVPNALETGRKPLRVSAVQSGSGSALVAPGGLELLPVTTQGNWNRFALVKDSSALRLFQGNGIGVEEFIVRNPEQMARFDAGSFLLSRTGE